MPMPSSPSYYSHVQRVLDAALANGGKARYVLPSAAAAGRWRLEAYAFRKVLLRKTEKITPPGMIASTPYDDLRIIVTKEEPNVCIIVPNEPTGTLTDEAGNPINLAPSIAETNRDALLDEAIALREGLLDD